ncbi:MAG: M1 family aminopeptidase, partial [Catalinimonas sp.]
MLWNIFKFELKYRLSRPATWIYFGLLFLLTLLAMTTDAVQIGGAANKVKINSPFTLAQMQSIVTVFAVFIASAVMGVPVVRDYEHQTEGLMFTKSITKRDYLFGRFLGSFVILALIFSGAVLGQMLGYAKVLWEPDRFLPFNFWHYWQPFFTAALPTLFVCGALFFMGGALSRRMLIVYTQGAILFGLYFLALTFAGQLDNRDVRALLDPFGLNASSVLTEYWTVAERNTQTIPLTGILLWNRLLWVGVGLLALAGTYFVFSFTKRRGGKVRKAAPAAGQQRVRTEEITIPHVTQRLGLGAYVKQTLTLTKFYFKTVIREIPFIAIVIMGLVFILIAALNNEGSYGIETYATSYSVLELVSSNFVLFFLIIVVFYTGELVWRERQVRINLIYDALPMPDAVGLIAKFLGLALIYAVLNLMLIGIGALIQVIKGFPDVDWGLYVGTLYTDLFATLLLYTLLGLFVHVMVNNKFVGYAIMVTFFIAMQILESVGVEHSLLQFGAGGLGTFSAMNRYGHYVTPFSWFSLYWLAFALVLFAAAVYFSVRGADTLIKTRAQVGRLRLTRPLLIFTLLSTAVFVSTGFYAYYNTNVVNTYRNSDAQEELQAEYERQLKQYEFIPQPKIVAVDAEVDLYPESRDFNAAGHYVLKNKTDRPVEALHVQWALNDEAAHDAPTFDRPATLQERVEAYDYEIWRLERPLAPGDSMRMDWRVRFETRGFRESGSSTRVVQNGTFFNNTEFFPTFGYNSGVELGSDEKRSEYDLPEQERMMARDDPRGLHQSLFGDDADRIRFGMTVSTAPDQIAIVPGYLQREWTEEGPRGDPRRHFRYEMDAPMVNFYSVVSAAYDVRRDSIMIPLDSGASKQVALEIYYHPEHNFNLDRMMRGMKDALTYYSAAFAPYQYRQLRIMEFPRYASFAQSFANTVPYSEDIGFMLNMDEDDIDLNYYVTAHEVAHQWWGHQVTEAGVRGNAMLSETLSQYSALMVMKNNYPAEQMQKFLRYELDSYLRGRTGEAKKEQPLEKVEGQGYIHYRKGSVIMYALQDYLGEETVNRALRDFRDEWAYREDIYPTSLDLLKHLRAATPDSLGYLIEDFFETITLFENKTEEATYRVLGDDVWEVTLAVSSRKLRADSLGNETPLAVAVWIDIGVYGEGSDGEDTLLYL